MQPHQTRIEGPNRNVRLSSRQLLAMVPDLDLTRSAFRGRTVPDQGLPANSRGPVLPGEELVTDRVTHSSLAKAMIGFAR